MKRRDSDEIWLTWRAEASGMPDGRRVREDLCPHRSGGSLGRTGAYGTCAVPAPGRPMTARFALCSQRKLWSLPRDDATAGPPTGRSPALCVPWRGLLAAGIRAAAMLATRTERPKTPAMTGMPADILRAVLQHQVRHPYITTQNLAAGQAPSPHRASTEAACAGPKPATVPGHGRANHQVKGR